MPQRGSKAATLVVMIVGHTLEDVIYITFLLSLTSGNILIDFLLTTPLSVVTISAIWWRYFGLHHLFRDQPATEMLGLALWFDYSVLTMSIAGASKDPYASAQNITIVLLLIVTTVDATLTTCLSQHLRIPQSWLITLAVGACQFMPISSAVYILYLIISAYVSMSAGKGLSNYTASAWFIWSESGSAGFSVAAGLLIFTVITFLTAAGLYLGIQRPFSTSLQIVFTSTISLLMLYNIVVVLAYGLPTVGEYAF